MLEKIANFERSFSPETTEEVILQGVKVFEKERGLRFNHYRKGSTDIVYILDSQVGEHNQEVIYGLGKGIYSKIGAYGECIEHFLYREIGLTHSKSIRTNWIKQSLKNYDADVLFEYATLLEGVPNELPCIEFSALDGNGRFPLPSLLINYYHLDQRKNGDFTDFEKFLTRYVTTSGSAFALSEEDATIHALNETLERDTLSEFFLEISDIESETKNTFYRLDLSTLPNYMKTPLTQIKESFDPVQIEIYFSRTVFNGWWSFCVAKFGESSSIAIPQWGAGYSLSVDLAVYRSVTECIQTLDAYENENKRNARTLIAFTEKFPKFRNVAYFNIEDHFPLKKYPAEMRIDEMPVPTQISRTTQTMIEKGFKPSKHIAHRDHSFFLACSYTPNLERFYNNS